MSPENFCYWLQGHFELTKDVTLNEDQVREIKAHLGYVFEKKPMPVPLSPPSKSLLEQLGPYADLSRIHDTSVIDPKIIKC